MIFPTSKNYNDNIRSTYHGSLVISSSLSIVVLNMMNIIKKF